MTAVQIRVTSEDGEECSAVVRRNHIDGRLYACGFSRSDAVHASVADCERLGGKPCFDPSAHHEFKAGAA